MSKKLGEIQERWRELLPEDMKAEVSTEPVERGDEEWRKELDAAAFEVLRHEATERPFTSRLNDEHRQGVFVCAGCGQPLFTSEMKYESGSGWPSFFKAIDGSVAQTIDRSHGMVRVEAHCANCGAHLGHIFPDGPNPTGERFCMNGTSLQFEPKA